VFFFPKAAPSHMIQYVPCFLWLSSDVFLSTVTIWHLCAISFERFYCVVFPLKFMIKRKERVKSLIIMAWLSGLLITIPFIVIAALDKTTIIQSEVVFLDDLNKTQSISNEIIRTNQTHFFYVKNSCNFYNVYFSIISIMFSFWIPMVLMLSLTCITMIMLNKSKSKLKPYNKNKLDMKTKHKPCTQMHIQANNQIKNSHNHEDKMLPNLDITKEPLIFSNHNNDKILIDNYAKTEKISVLPANNVCECAFDVNTPKYHVTKIKLHLASKNDSTDIKKYIESPNSKRCFFQFFINRKNRNPYKDKSSSKEHSSNKDKANQKNSHYSNNKHANIICKETEAQRRSLIVLVAFIIGYTPVFSLITISWCTNIELNSNYFVFLTWLGYLSSALNPSLYAWMNRNLRQAFHMIITCRIGSRNEHIKKFTTETMQIAVKRF
jgi:hypothetical protein